MQVLGREIQCDIQNCHASIWITFMTNCYKPRNHGWYMICHFQIHPGVSPVDSSWGGIVNLLQVNSFTIRARSSSSIASRRWIVLCFHRLYLGWTLRPSTQQPWQLASSRVVFAEGQSAAHFVREAIQKMGAQLWRSIVHVGDAKQSSWEQPSIKPAVLSAEYE